MMVKQTRVIFEIGDILAFRVECKCCSNEVTLRLDSDKGIPDDCPMCNSPKWIIGTKADRLLRYLREAADTDPKVGTIIHLEIDCEEKSN